MENMDNTNNYDDILSFVAPKESDSYIKVIGVGGGGCNAVNHMYRQGIVGVNFVVCNTDAQALQQSPVPVKIQLGRTKGLGAGNVPAVAQQAALEKKDEIKEVISDTTHMLFVTAGMGGGTGTGAAPVVASVAKEIELDDDVKEILVVGIVSTPFSFEGRRRLQQAQEGIKELRKYVDAILVINNDNLRTMGGKIPFKDALAKADDVLSTAAKGISEIITVHTMINVDFRDVNTVMSQSGVALMGVGRANGENRAKEAIMAAMDSPLLNDNSIEGAKSILLCVIGSEKAPLLLEEVYVVAEYVRSHVGNEVEVIYGAGADNCAEDYLQVTLVATGFNEKSYEQGRTYVAEISADGQIHSGSTGEVMMIRDAHTGEAAPALGRTSAAMPGKRVVALDERPVTITPQPAADNHRQEISDSRQTAVQEERAAAMAQAWFSDLDKEEQPSAPAPAPEETVTAAAMAVSETLAEATVEEAPVLEMTSVAAEVEAEMPLQAAAEAVPSQAAAPAEMPTMAAPAAEIRAQEEVRPSGYTTVYRVERPSAQPAYEACPAQETRTAVMDYAPMTSYAQHPSYQERMDRMRRFKEQLDVNGLDYIEKVPAWKRKEMDLNPTVPASQSEMSDMMIAPDGRLTPNAYLRDNERVD